MTTIRGSALDITKRKIQDLISCHQGTVNKDGRMEILNQVLYANTNQAYYAAMVVALKTSGIIDKIKEEIQHPSFEIPDAASDYVDIPSLYTSKYQPQSEYDYEPIEYRSPPNPTHPQEVSILSVNIGQTALARIVIPFYL